MRSVDDISAALTAREIWSICPADWEVYGASSCPVNLLGPVLDAGRNDAFLLYTAEYGDDVACEPPGNCPLPEGRLVVLRPEAAWRSCASDFALVPAADEQSRSRAEVVDQITRVQPLGQLAPVGQPGLGDLVPRQLRPEQGTLDPRPRRPRMG